MLFNLLIIIVSVLLIITILLQQRGSGLGAAFGGEGNVYMAKRGAEKVIFWASIVLAVLFMALGVARILLV